jgi:hypothetical protein
LVLNIPLDLDEQSPADKQGFIGLLRKSSRPPKPTEALRSRYVKYGSVGVETSPQTFLTAPHA